MSNFSNFMKANKIQKQNVMHPVTKSLVDENTDATIIKGYKQQVKVIKAILDKIEFLIADYNVKKNQVDNDNVKFSELYESVNSMLTKLQSIA